jgi:hypothetical protein
MPSAGDVQLETGREIRMHELAQSKVYAGLLEGVPTREMNRRTVEAAVEGARVGGRAVYLVPPQETPIPGHDGYPFGEPASLPSTMCIARFASAETTTTGSMLTIIWFQHDFALPIDAAVLAHIRGVDWAALAVVREY